MPGHHRTGALVALVLSASPGFAQPPDLAAGHLVVPKILSAPAVRTWTVGSEIAIPRPAQAQPAPGNAEAANPGMSCRLVCSLYTPREVIAHLSFPERLVSARATPAAALPEVRVDIAGTPGGFRDGNFGTVALQEVALVEVAPGTGIDVERLRQIVTPAFMAQVQAHRIVAREPTLDPQRLRPMLAASGAAFTPPADMQEALQRDARRGGLAQMRFLAQGVEVRRGQPLRTVVLDGLQPGLTYGVRLVRERLSGTAITPAANAAGGETVVENICRVPVCPADFMAPR